MQRDVDLRPKLSELSQAVVVTSRVILTRPILGCNTAFKSTVVNATRPSLSFSARSGSAHGSRLAADPYPAKSLDHSFLRSPGSV